MVQRQRQGSSLGTISASGMGEWGHSHRRRRLGERRGMPKGLPHSAPGTGLRQQLPVLRFRRSVVKRPLRWNGVGLLRTEPQNSLVFTFSHVHPDFSTGTEPRSANRNIARAPILGPPDALPRAPGRAGTMESACRHVLVAKRDWPVCEGHAVDRPPLWRARPGGPAPRKWCLYRQTSPCSTDDVPPRRGRRETPWTRHRRFNTLQKNHLRLSDPERTVNALATEGTAFGESTPVGRTLHGSPSTPDRKVE